MTIHFKSQATFDFKCWFTVSKVKNIAHDMIIIMKLWCPYLLFLSVCSVYRCVSYVNKCDVYITCIIFQWELECFYTGNYTTSNEYVPEVQMIYLG
jgi:hypothetical protein